MATDPIEEKSRAAPLRIGMSARLLHRPPIEMGFSGKTLQYLEQSVAHWILRHGGVALMVPTLGADAEVSRRRVSVREYAEVLDGLVLQGGADVSPRTYGQDPLQAAWAGDPIRDRYEIELIEGFLALGKPVLGICRGCQLLNVAFGGSLVQDLASQRANAKAHVDPALYDEHCHGIEFTAGSELAGLYGPDAVPMVNSIHHQAIDRLGGDLCVEAVSVGDGVIEAIRGMGALKVSGVQWHPEFHLGREDRLDPEPLMNAFLHDVRERARA